MGPGPHNKQLVDDTTRPSRSMPAPSVQVQYTTNCSAECLPGSPLVSSQQGERPHGRSRSVLAGSPPPDGQEGSSLDPATTPFRNGIHPVSMPTCLPGSLATRLAREGILKGGARVRVRESRALVVFFDFFFFSPSHNSFSLVLSLSCGAQSYFYLPDNPWLCAPVVLVRRIASSPCLAVGYMYLPMYSIRRTDRLYTRDGVFGTEVS